MLTRRVLSVLLVGAMGGWRYTASGTGTTFAAGTLTTQNYIDIQQIYAEYTT